MSQNTDEAMYSNLSMLKKDTVLTPIPLNLESKVSDKRVSWLLQGSKLNTYLII